MPVSFFAMLGGTCSLIGTSTNLIVSSFLEDVTGESLAFFQFADKEDQEEFGPELPMSGFRHLAMKVDQETQAGLLHHEVRGPAVARLILGKAFLSLPQFEAESIGRDVQ